MIVLSPKAKQREDQLLNVMSDVFVKWEHEADNLLFESAGLWRLKIVKSKVALGRCVYKTKTIEIDAFHLENDEYEEVLDTILHECAHALCGFSRHKSGRANHHGKDWKMWARRVGASPRATKSLSSSDPITIAKRKNRKMLVVFHDAINKSVTPVCAPTNTRQNLTTAFMPNDKERTKSNLWYIPLQTFISNQGDYQRILSEMKRECK